MRLRTRMRRRRVVPVVAALLAIAVAVGLLAAAPLLTPRAAPLQAAISRFVSVSEAPDSAARIRLDTSLYLPARTPAPAVLLVHGFGQDKTALTADARRLQGEGYVVLAYSARGFGRSGGRIGLDSLDGEVPDARALVSVLAARPEVRKYYGHPIIGVVGGSYGGALALMLGATDRRIVTVVAEITRNDLAQALDPVSSSAGGTERVFKSGWASRLFGATGAGGTDPCGRFTPQLCTLYQKLVTGGSLDDADRALLAQSSPASVLGSRREPTLLLQGEQDSLFGLDQSDANLQQLRAARVPVQLGWFDGGHDGGGTAGTEQAVDSWLDARLMHFRWPGRQFSYAVPAGATSFAQTLTAPGYPGLDGDGHRVVPLSGGAQAVVNPPGGQPASVTGLPGLGTEGVGQQAGGLLARENPPGQAARFFSGPFRSPAVLAGTLRMRLRITPASPPTPGEQAVLFGQLSAVTGSGARVLPGGVAPIRVPLPASGTTVDVALPATAWAFAPGDRLAVTFRTTDSQYLGSTAPASFRVAVDGVATLPTVAPRATTTGSGLPARSTIRRIGMLLAIALALLLGTAIVGFVRRRVALRTEAATVADVPPLAAIGVTKRFRSGFLAVDDASFTMRPGQVVGLLGENGAGKTTTLRMVLGLLRPDAGAIEVFGVPVEPGSPVLRRVGCFVEGPGFLPHLSGRRNLQLFWAATGRPRREARFEEALAVADLGSAIRKPVRGYSQGMRQRLAIAQAMLGMPDLLVLDEPTNGLDPPQITALRGVLRRYAEGGRTVLVSSHLLAEVERTCSHVVVMSHGRVVAAGPVDTIAGGGDELLLDVSDAAAAVEALSDRGVVSVEARGTDAVRVLPCAVPVDELVSVLARAGITVTGLRTGRHLEEAFLQLIGRTGSAG